MFLSSFLNMTSAEMQAAGELYKIVVSVELLNVPKYIHVVMDARVRKAYLYENNVIVEKAELCDVCDTEYTDSSGCMCSLPKGYCYECDDTKCHTFHCCDDGIVRWGKRMY